MELKLQEKIDSKSKMVNFRATESEIKFLKEEANKRGTSLSNFLRMMVNKGLKSS